MNMKAGVPDSTWWPGSGEKNLGILAKGDTALKGSEVRKSWTHYDQ
jgi:hypothetical protein